MQIADPTKSLLKRCKHHVFNPHGTPGGIDNDCCSLCRPLTVPADFKFVYIRRSEDGKFVKLEE
jgi:hypothetical protein